MNPAKRLLKGLSRDATAEAVAEVNCGVVIVGLLKSKKERRRLEPAEKCAAFWGINLSALDAGLYVASDG